MTASTAIRRNTRSSRGDNTSLRLQRIRRPTGGRNGNAVAATAAAIRRESDSSKRSSGFSAADGSSVRSVGMCTTGVGGDHDDMSVYQYSVIDPSQFRDPTQFRNDQPQQQQPHQSQTHLHPQLQQHHHQFIITTTTTNVTPNMQVEEMCCETIDDESLYTSRDPTLVPTYTDADWEEMRMQSAMERKNRMAIAGQDNSIPTMIMGGGAGFGGSSRYMNASNGKLNMNSLRSVFSFDPTEEESYEGTDNNEPTSMIVVHQLSEDTGARVPVDTIEEDEATLFPEPRPCAATLKKQQQQQQQQAKQKQQQQQNKKTKKNFMKRFFKSLFKNNKSGKTNNNKTNKKSKNSARKAHAMRQSAPAMLTPSELWNSVEVPNKNRKPTSASTLQGSTVTATTASTTITGRRSRHSSTPAKMAPQDLWAPEQAQARGMENAKLRVSETGVRTWENASGRIIPFSAAEV